MPEDDSNDPLDVIPRHPPAPPKQNKLLSMQGRDATTSKHFSHNSIMSKNPLQAVKEQSDACRPRSFSVKAVYLSGLGDRGQESFEYQLKGRWEIVTIKARKTDAHWALKLQAVSADDGKWILDCQTDDALTRISVGWPLVADQTITALAFDIHFEKFSKSRGNMRVPQQLLSAWRDAQSDTDALLAASKMAMGQLLVVISVDQLRQESELDNYRETIDKRFLKATEKLECVDCTKRTKLTHAQQERGSGSGRAHACSVCRRRHGSRSRRCQATPPSEGASAGLVVGKWSGQAGPSCQGSASSSFVRLHSSACGLDIRCAASTARSGRQGDASPHRGRGRRQHPADWCRPSCSRGAGRSSAISSSTGSATGIAVGLWRDPDRTASRER